MSCETMAMMFDMSTPRVLVLTCNGVTARLDTDGAPVLLGGTEGCGVVVASANASLFAAEDPA